MIEIRYQLTVQVPDGPRKVVADVVTVETYAVFAVVLEADPDPGATQTLDLLSAAAAANVTFVMITADVYDALTYEIAGSGTPRALDGPHLLIGRGVVSQLDAPLTAVTLTNTDTAAPRAVEILIGRDL
jgi:hypothetical protein